MGCPQAAGEGTRGTNYHMSIVQSGNRIAQIPYHETLLEFPLKGDETALRSMEHAELITISTRDGMYFYHLNWWKFTGNPHLRAAFCDQTRQTRLPFRV